MVECAAPPVARISSQTSEASLMSRISTFAPSAARRIAAARPSPSAAPETIATRSFKRIMFLLFFSPLSGEGRKGGQKNVRQKNEELPDRLHFSVSHFSVRSSSLSSSFFCLTFFCPLFFPCLWVPFLFLSLKFSELSVNRVQRHQSLERVCARRDQHRGVVADLLRLSHCGDRPRRLFLLLAQSPLRRDLIDVIQQTAPDIGIGPDLEQHLVQLVSGGGRMLVEL